MNSFIKYAILLLLMEATGCHKDSVTNNSNSTQVIPNDFLSNTNYDKLVVEIQYLNGFAPTAEAMNNLSAFLQLRLSKTAGITIVQKTISSPGKSTYTLAEIQGIENVNRTQKTSGKTLTAYFFFADGDYSANGGSSKVLGVAYGSSSMVIFEKTIRDFSGGVTQPPLNTLESTVIHHEFGHILGLVDNGTPMQTAHLDTSHGKHCDDQNCLMYYAAETSDIVGNLVGGNIPALNAKCLNDLKGNGGK